MATHIVSGGGDALKNAINSSSNNDVLLIEDGIYNNVIINKYNLTLSSINGPDNCIIDGQNLKRCISTNSNSNRHKIYGLTLRNGRVLSGDGQYRSSESGGGGAGAYLPFVVSNCKIVNCYSYGAGGGIIPYNNNRVVINNCYFENCYSEKYSGGCQGSAKECYFKDCDCGGWGGVIMDATSVQNCIFDHCGSGNSYVLHANNGANGIVKNCIFKNCYSKSNSANYGLVADYNVINCIAFGTKYGVGLRMSGNIYGCTFLNNQFTSNKAVDITRTAGYQVNSGGTFICNNIFNGSGIYIAGTRSNKVTVSHNLVGTTIYHTSTVSSYFAENNITGSVTFENNYENDAHLSAGSDGIDNGSIEWCKYTTDFEGKLWKDPPSIGAYQYLSNVSNTPNKIYPV